MQCRHSFTSQYLPEAETGPTKEGLIIAVAKCEKLDNQDQPQYQLRKHPLHSNEVLTRPRNEKQQPLWKDVSKIQREVKY